MAVQRGLERAQGTGNMRSTGERGLRPGQYSSVMAPCGTISLIPRYFLLQKMVGREEEEQGEEEEAEGLPLTGDRAWDVVPHGNSKLRNGLFGHKVSTGPWRCQYLRKPW